MKILPSGEFVENENYFILIGQNRWGRQHIATKKDDMALCKVRIKHRHRIELFSSGNLCGKCEQLYHEKRK